MDFLVYINTRPSTVFYIMLVIDEMIHFCCLEIIYKFSFRALKSNILEYMKEYRQLFSTFNDILQQTFDKTICGTTIFTNIKKLIIKNFS